MFSLLESGIAQIRDQEVLRHENLPLLRKIQTRELLSQALGNLEPIRPTLLSEHHS